MTYETEVREHAKELGYRLIKVPATDRYNLAENHWYGSDLNEIEEKLEEIEQEMYGDEDEQPSALPVAPPGPPAVTPAPVVAPDSGDLDTEIADLTEKIRQTLWRYAAREWWCHYVDEEPPPSLDTVDAAICQAMAHAWQRGIDLGVAQPIAEEPGNDFVVPDREWIGLGLDDSRHAAWDELWEYVEMMIGFDEIRRLERRWVEREVYTLLVPEDFNEQIDGLFDEDGDWKSEELQANLYIDKWINGNALKVPKPTFFRDDLIEKIDHSGAPDYAHGWWDEEQEDDEEEDEEDEE